MKPIALAVGVLLLLAAGATAQVAETPAETAFIQKLVAAAEAREKVHVRYVSAYVKLAYPGGDVPGDTGVCTDEVIRSYRAVGVDLQKEVHEDMVKHLAEYPLHGSRADANIDHRRVPNLQKFFERNGTVLAITRNSDDYRPGDIVTWDLGGGLTHIGMVVSRMDSWGWGQHMLLHNIGAGPKLEAVLFGWKITGHYRYYGPVATTAAK